MYEYYEDIHVAMAEPAENFSLTLTELIGLLTAIRCSRHIEKATSRSLLVAYTTQKMLTLGEVENCTSHLGQVGCHYYIDPDGRNRLGIF